MFINTQTMFLESIYALAPIFIWTGLMGGGSYVNVMKNLLDLETLNGKEERDVALVLSLMFNDCGVLLAALFTLVVDNTIFKMH
jgi:hypothetical protein